MRCNLHTALSNIKLSAINLKLRFIHQKFLLRAHWTPVPGSIAWALLLMTNTGNVKHHRLAKHTYCGIIKIVFPFWKDVNLDQHGAWRYPTSHCLAFYTRLMCPKFGHCH